MVGAAAQVEVRRSSEWQSAEHDEVTEKRMRNEARDLETLVCTIQRKKRRQNTYTDMLEYCKDSVAKDDELMTRILNEMKIGNDALEKLTEQLINKQSLPFCYLAQ